MNPLKGRSRSLWMGATVALVLGVIAIAPTSLWAQGGNPTLGGMDPDDVEHFPGSIPLPPEGGQGNIAVIQGQGDVPYWYGGGSWPDLTAAIDAACTSVTVLNDASDLNQMLLYDAVWLDQRWVGGSLTDTEEANLADIINSGRRVVMIGENGNWTGWDNQILGLVGGSYVGPDVSGPQDATGGSALLNGVSQVNVSAAGTANGGSPLFTNNWATEFGNNVVTVLEVNAQGENWNDLDNATFFNNVASWICNSEAPVPTTPEWSKGALLLLLLLVSLVVIYRFRQERRT